MAKVPVDDYWVYILLCENNSYYTGYTVNLPKRYTEHINGTSRCKYTSSFKPLTIVQCWRVKKSKSLAMHLENAIKRLPRNKKEHLISTPKTLSTDPRVQPVAKQTLHIMIPSLIHETKNIQKNNH